ncbi:MAG: SIS domain-containing protein [Nitrospiraceae bacterium]|nr:SIS domain-containing protein [Nitrospiraceae bacterium]
MDFQTYRDDIEKLMATVDVGEVDRLVDAIAAAYDANKTVFIVGNGGSGANASHLCEDLGKGTLSDFDTQKRLKVLSLTDNAAYILAWGNDTSFDRVFVEQLKNLASEGDLLLVISGSGNSPNVLTAVEWANGAGLITFGITGYDGGRLLELCADSFHVRSHDMGMVEAVHSVAFHYLTDALKERFAR